MSGFLNFYDHATETHIALNIDQISFIVPCRSKHKKLYSTHSIHTNANGLFKATITNKEKRRVGIEV